MVEREKIFDNEPRSLYCRMSIEGTRSRERLRIGEGEYPVQKERERERKEDRGGSWGARPVLIIMHSVECCNYRAASLMHLLGTGLWKMNNRIVHMEMERAWVGVRRKILMAHGNHYPFSSFPFYHTSEIFTFSSFFVYWSLRILYRC